MKRIIIVTDTGDRLEAEVKNETFRLLRAETGRKTRCGDRIEEVLVEQEAFDRITKAMAANTMTAGQVLDRIIGAGLQ